MNDLTDRAIRQRELVPPDRLQSVTTIVIGVGAIGRQVALQLAALGVSNAVLMDDDIVATENLAPQGFWPEDLGRHKVTVTAQLCRRIHPVMTITATAERFRRSTARSFQHHKAAAVFLCVDRIDTRRLIWNAVRSWASVVIDGRMHGEVLRVLASDRPRVDSKYAGTLFESSEAFSGSCTSRSTIYTASIAAGFMIGQFARSLRGLPVVADQTLNLLSAELLAK